MDAPSDALLVQHALAQARQLADKVRGRQRADLDGDADFFSVICWRLLELTAATAQVSAELQGRYLDFPWRELLGLRRRLIHGQPCLDRDILWLVLTRDLPPLTPVLQEMLAEKPGSKRLSRDQLREAIRPAGANPGERGGNPL